MPTLPENQDPSLLAEAGKEMDELGIDPECEGAWKMLGLILLKERRRAGPHQSQDGETIEISKKSYDTLMAIAGPAVRLITDHKKIEKSYLAANNRTQRDVLEHAITALKTQEEWFDKFGVSRFGGVPTPLRIVLADLINVLEERFGRSVSPPDQKIENSEKVTDSRSDRIRLTIHAYAASTVHRLIQSGENKNKAYDAVAEALDRAGFTKPGKDDPIKGSGVRSWYESTHRQACPFADEYQRALKAAKAEPKELLAAFEDVVQSLIFHR